MKTRTIKFMLMATALFSIALFAACGSDDDKPNAAKNREDLATSIADAEVLIATTEEGDIEDQYQANSQATLQVAIDAATEVFMDAKATQKEVNAANANLQTAITVYKGKKNAPIQVADLIARWRFDEGSGTTTADESVNALNATFKTGHAFWGAGNPSWSTDRHGNVNRAIYFDDGAHLEVPYNTKLNPDNITITLWMKQDVNTPAIVNNQYMIAMNRWNGYKFNMQDVPKPFFTVNPQEAPGSHINEDSALPNEGLTQGTWYHLAVSFGQGHMKFYINGTLTKDWAHTGTILDISATPVNLTIGQDLPNEKYSTVDGNDNYVNWGGHFIGSMDDIRMYKSVLTDQQITDIYNNEKP